MHSDIFSADNMVQPPTRAGMSLQHSRCVRYTVNGEVRARQGSMVAWRGNLTFETQRQGIRNFVKRAVTGEGVPLMTVRGQGEAWFAEGAASCFVIDLEQNDVLTINGRNILCFDPTLAYEIRMVQGAGMLGGGLFNSVFSGHGQLAVLSNGQPLVIPVTPQVPVFVDTNSVIGWSHELRTSIHRSESLKSVLRGGSGELFQLRLDGQGFVLVQPSEGLPYSPAAAGDSGSTAGSQGGLLGSFLGG